MESCIIKMEMCIKVYGRMGFREAWEAWNMRIEITIQVIGRMESGQVKDA